MGGVAFFRKFQQVQTIEFDKQLEPVGTIVAITNRWTDKEDACLRRHWLQGLEVSLIAPELPGRNKNMIISRAHRLGLPPHQRKVTATVIPIGQRPPPRTSVQTDVPAVPRQMKPIKSTEPAEPVVSETALLPDTPSPPEFRVGLLDLEAQHCRWPIGDPRSEKFHFCGRDKVSGLPYCSGHAQIAYVSPATYRKNAQNPSIPARQKKEFAFN